MADKDSGYFGMRLGESIAAGAGHISSALQRKYAMQAQAEEQARERAEMQKRQEQMLQQQQGLMLAKEGYEMSPAGFEKFIADRQKGRAMTTRGQEADVALKEAQAARLTTPRQGGAFGVEKLTVGGIEREIPVRYTDNGPIPISMGSQSSQKPLTQAQANAAQGVVATDKMLSMLDAAEGKPIGRLGGLGGTLSQKSILGKALRIGDPTAQEFASAKDEVIDLIARIRTGAVITSNEEKIYANKIYSILQNEGINRKNIQMVRDYFQRVLPKGYNPQSMSYEEPVPMGGANDFTPAEIEQFERMIAEGK